MADNRPPNLQGLPDISFHQTSSDKVINLADYVYDPDNDVDDLVFSISGGSRISANIDADDKLIFSMAPPKYSTESFEVTVTDPGGLKDTDSMSVTSTRFLDGGDQCRSQKDDVKKNFDFLGEKASAIEQAVYIIYALCAATTAIEAIVSFYSFVWPGSVERNYQCYTWIACGSTPHCTPALIPCTATDIISHAVGNWYKVVKILCCFVTCGWCSSYTKPSEKTRNNPASGPSAGCPNPYGITSLLSSGVNFIGVSLDPFENIFTAMICMCPVAILFNLRKIKVVYSVYDCCVELSCEGEIDKQVCDSYLQEAQCMFFDAAMEKTLIKIIAQKLLAWIVSTYAGEAIIDMSGPIGMAIRFFTIPLTIYNLYSIMMFISHTFDEPSVSDCKNDFMDYMTEHHYTPTEQEWADFVTEKIPEDWDVHPKDLSIDTGQASGNIIFVRKNGLEKGPPLKKTQSNALWSVLSYALDEWAFDSIDEQCKKEVESSRPEHPGPIQNVVSNSVENLRYCATSNRTTVHGEGTILKHSGTKYEVDVTWSVTNCNRTSGSLDYGVWLITGSGLTHQLQFNSTDFDQSRSGSARMNMSLKFTKIAIWTQDPNLRNNGKPEFDLIEI